MTQIIINIEDGKCTLGGEAVDVRKPEVRTERPSSSNAIMQGNLAKSIWETIKDWKIERTGGLFSASYSDVQLIIDAVVRANEWNAVERQQIIDEANKRIKK